MHTLHLFYLIPKAAQSNFSYFKPICLCQEVYKILSKIISNIFSILMPKLIASAQGGSIKGRVITENVALASEICSNLNKKVSGNVVLKIDMSKVFESVSWNFLFKVHKAFGFSDE